MRRREDERWQLEGKGIKLIADMIEATPHCDAMPLLSGNGDFAAVIEAVQWQGCRVIVVSSEKAESSTVADVLLREADEFMELLAIASEVAMRE